VRTSCPEGRGLEARERGSWLFFIVRLEPGLRLSGAAYRLGDSNSPTRASRWDVSKPCDWLLEQFELSGPRQGVRAAVGVQLAVEVIDVGLDGAHADEELG
jgi:hypothetical protein